MDPNDPARDERWNEDNLQYAIFRDEDGNITFAGDKVKGAELETVATGEDYHGPPLADSFSGPPLPPDSDKQTTNEESFLPSWFDLIENRRYDGEDYQ